jgi:hypothetical protein
MESKALAAALARRLAAHRVDDQVIAGLVRELEAVEQPPIDVDVCTLGICVDYFIDRGEVGKLFEKLRDSANLGPIRVFPKGILQPDGFLVQVEHSLNRNP